MKGLIEEQSRNQVREPFMVKTQNTEDDSAENQLKYNLKAGDKENSKLQMKRTTLTAYKKELRLKVLDDEESKPVLSKPKLTTDPSPLLKIEEPQILQDKNEEEPQINPVE